MFLDRFLTLEQKRKKRLAKATANESAGPVKKYLEAPFVSPHLTLDEVVFVALDLEATGLDIEKDEILSVGFVMIEQMSIKLSEARYFLVKPEQAIPEETAVVHGIMDDKSSQGVPLKEAIPIILNALKGKVLLAHHANIECQFINQACQKLYGCEVIFPVVDTYAIEYKSLKHRGITPANNGLRLYNLREDYSLPRYQAHNALSDAIAAGELFLAQVASRQGNQAIKLKEILTRC